MHTVAWPGSLSGRQVIRDMDALSLSARKVCGELRAKKLSPVELMQLTLQRAKQLTNEFSAFITIAEEEAMAQARAYERAYARGETLPAFAGLPVSVKDTEDTAGIRTTYGSPLFLDNVPLADSAVVANLKRAGSVVFAKSNTPAFAHNDTGNNLLGPPARNPRMPTHSSGGSSSGAAVCVAAGLSPFAHGTDGAGSVRIPASLCGIVGFKPSLGRIPLWPHRDLWAARTHHGVLARTVEDAAAGMIAMAQPSDFDPLSTTTVVDWLSYRSIGGVAALRGAYLEQLGNEPVDTEVDQACRRAVHTLQEAGLKIEPLSLPTDDTQEWYCDLWQPLFARQMAPFLSSKPELIDPTLTAILERGRRVDMDRFMLAREARSRFHSDFTRRTSGYSYLITPTLPCAAWPVEGTPAVGGGQPPKYPKSGSRWESVYFFNILGWPAISVPCGKTRDGRPIGIQIIARRDNDLLCLNIAGVLEQSLRFQPSTT